MDNLCGVSLDERNGRYRVIRTFPSGQHAVLGIYGCLSQALDAATAEVLRGCDDEQEDN